MMYRQGDLLIKNIDEVVEGKDLNKLTIAEGEFTGHNHVLVAEAQTVIRGTKQKFTLTGKATLVHPEHKSFDLPKGTYVVMTEREHDYVENAMKQVQD